MYCIAFQSLPALPMPIASSIATASRFVGPYCETTKKPQRPSLLQGDNNNFWPSASLYEKVRLRVIRSVRASPDEIEDAYHEAILSVVSSACREKPPATPSKVEDYLTKATRNKLVDAIRRRSGTVRKHDEFAAETTTTRRFDQENAETQAIDVERLACFHLFLESLEGRRSEAVDDSVSRLFASVQAYLADQLTDKHWIVLRAHGLHDAGFDACATLIQSSTGTAYNRWKEAVVCVREAFLKYGVEFDGRIL